MKFAQFSLISCLVVENLPHFQMFSYLFQIKIRPLDEHNGLGPLKISRAISPLSRGGILLPTSTRRSYSLIFPGPFLIQPQRCAQLSDDKCCGRVLRTIHYPSPLPLTLPLPPSLDATCCSHFPCSRLTSFITPFPLRKVPSGRSGSGTFRNRKLSSRNRVSDSRERELFPTNLSRESNKKQG